MPKVAFITGASRGIGAALAKTFAKNGYHLSLCCRNSKSELHALANSLKEQYSIEVLTFIGNIGEYDFLSHMVKETLSHFGSIDVLINNAAISHIGLLSDMTIDEWNELIAINLTSVFSACQQIIPTMVHQKKGNIINISSVWGNIGASCEVAYSACKGGVNALTKALGKELAPSGISVNAIACGVIDTHMNSCFSSEEKTALASEIPAGRFGSPEEVAELALSIVNSANYLTGQIITFDGGWT